MKHMTTDWEDWKGRDYVSELERSVARELDEAGVSFVYEQQVVLADGTSPKYLPDFTIIEAPQALRLPEYVEVKPQSFLYELRDLLGVTRMHGERFREDISVDGGKTTSQHLEKYADPKSSIWELFKPKRLAEVTNRSVLVVGNVQGTNSLSVLMRSDSIVFSREHPFVNSTGEQRKAERIAANERWRAQEAERQQQRQRDALTYAAATQKRTSEIAAWAAQPRKAAKFDGVCSACNQKRSKDHLSVVILSSLGGYGLLCVGCRSLVPSR